MNLNDTPNLPLTEPESLAASPAMPPDPFEAAIGSISAMVESIQRSIEQLQADFETKIKYDQSKEHTIDALHRELQDYRADLVLKIMRPLVNDLITLYDDISQIISGYSPDQNNEVSALLSHLAGIQADIEEMLARHGYEMFMALDEQHDSAIQRVQKVIDTRDSVLDHTIARRVRKGVRYAEKVIRPEVVDIYRYVETESE